MNFKQYDYFNRTVSSEMFYSLMAVLHERLPLSSNFFRLKKQFREQRKAVGCSPVRTIASPKMIRGLSIGKTSRNTKSDISGSSPTSSPDIRIKNVRHSELSRRASATSKKSNAGVSNHASPETLNELNALSLTQGSNFLSQGINNGA
jgi:hypothetical protein